MSMMESWDFERMTTRLVVLRSSGWLDLPRRPGTSSSLGRMSSSTLRRDVFSGDFCRVVLEENSVGDEPAVVVGDELGWPEEFSRECLSSRSLDKRMSRSLEERTSRLLDERFRRSFDDWLADKWTSS